MWPYQIILSILGRGRGRPSMSIFEKKLDEDGEDVDVLRRPDMMRIREFFCEALHVWLERNSLSEKWKRFERI